MNSRYNRQKMAALLKTEKKECIIAAEYVVFALTQILL